MLSHYTLRYENIFTHEGSYPLMFDGANYFVRIFFLLSGFFGAAALVKCEHPFEYIAKRFVKLYPCYWIAIIIIFPLTTFLLKERSVSSNDFIVSITMFQEVFGFKNVDGAHWTLLLELFFYIDIFIILLLRLNKYADKILLVWIILMLAPYFIPQLHTVPFSYFYKLTYRLFLRDYAQVFAIGAAVFLLRDQRRSAKYISGIVIVLCLVLEYCVRSWQGTVFLLSVALIVYITEELRIRNIKQPKFLDVIGKPFAFIAGISYPLYLVHQNIGYIIIKYMEKIGLTNEFYLLIPISIMIIFAWFLAKYIERPAIIFLQKILVLHRNRKVSKAE